MRVWFDTYRNLDAGERCLSLQSTACERARADNKSGAGENPATGPNVSTF